MKQKRAGHVWNTGKNVVPAVISSYDVLSEHVQKVNKARHPLWVLDYSFTGHGRYRVKDPGMKTAERKPNTVHLYAPDTTYWEHTETAEGVFHSAWIIFRGGDEAGLRDLLTSRDYAQFFDPTERMGNFIVRTAHLGQRFGEHGYWRAQALLCHIIHMLLNAEPVQGGDYFIQHQDRLSHVSDFVRKVERCLREYLGEKVTLDKLADIMHMSKSALSHRFKRERGKTPIALLHRMRINYAGQQVLKGYPLKEIADELGYCDEFHLSKMFRKITGKSPSEYKKSLRTTARRPS